MAVGVLDFCDCMTIQKAFEQGAIHSVSRQSVFAMMTPILTPIRVNTRTFINQTESAEQIEYSSSTGLNAVGGDSFNDLNNKDQNDSSFIEDIKGKFIEDTGQFDFYDNKKKDIGKIFDTKCIPCGLRLSTFEEITESWLAGAEGYLNSYLEYWKNAFNQMLAELESLVKLFTDKSNWIDFCTLMKWLLEFVCLPDLTRILSLLMAFMLKINLDFGGIFDLIISLVAPLLVPLLSGLVDQVQKYILMVIAPLECIVDSILEMLRKMDYNILFENIAAFDKTFNFGPQKGPFSSDPRGDVKIEEPMLGLDRQVKIPLASVFPNVPRHDVSANDERKWSGSFNLLNGISGGAIKRQRIEEEKAVEEAAGNLAKLEDAASKIDGKDASEVEKYRAQREEAVRQYNEAVQERDLSEIGQMRDSIQKTTAALKSSLLLLINQIKAAAAAIEKFANDLFDELKKILGIWFGGSGTFINLLFDKLGLIQMISLIGSIISWVGQDFDCKDDNGNAIMDLFIPKESNIIAFTDENGDLHLEDDPVKFKLATEAMIKAIGSKPSISNLNEVQEKDQGTLPSEEESRQKLKSLIEFTGDPVLDIRIARVTETLTVPVKVVFKCPLQTSVEDANQVNKWISELET